MPRARVRSLAKINLDLRILNRREDGFHELRTIFQTVSLSDSIEISYTPARRSSVSIESIPEIPDNIILKAADLVLSEIGNRGKVAFRVDKHIPMGGGLGGGSSNAAAVLLALPVLAGKRLPLDTLLELASQLGSDVPFFLLGGTAVGLGRGTELYPLPDVRAKPALLVCTGLHVSTAAAYGGLQRELTPVLPFRTIGSFQSFAWLVGDSAAADVPGAINLGAVNEFETVVFNQHPQLKSIKGSLLKSGACPALMSGSGSSIFGVFNNRVERDRAAGSLKKELGSKQVHSVSLVNRRQYRSLWWRQLFPETGAPRMATEPASDRIWPPGKSVR